MTVTGNNEKLSVIQKDAKEARMYDFPGAGVQSKGRRDWTGIQYCIINCKNFNPVLLE
jgi:hypothetical protein